MRRRQPLPEHLAGRPFSTRDAKHAGVGRGRLRGRDLAAPFHGSRVAADHDALLSAENVAEGDARWARLNELAIARAQAYEPRLPDGAAFSHLTAARVHGLPLPHRLAEDLAVHVSVLRRAARPERPGVVAHLVPPRRQAVERRNGLMTTTAVDTWCALSTMLTLDELVVVGDALVRRKKPLATMDDLTAAVMRHAGRHGAKLLRIALDLVRPRTDSPTETELRLAIVHAGLPEPEINVWVVDSHGVRLRLGDLVYPEHRILIEYDGEHHFSDPLQRRKDIDVLDAAVADGWRVINVHRLHRREAFRTVIPRIRTALLRSSR